MDLWIYLRQQTDYLTPSREIHIVVRLQNLNIFVILSQPRGYTHTFYDEGEGREGKMQRGGTNLMGTWRGGGGGTSPPRLGRKRQGAAAGEQEQVPVRVRLGVAR